MTVAKPRPPAAAPRAIKDPDAAGRLLAVATQVDVTGRDPWPQRDLALVARFCVTGIRETEAAALNIGSIDSTRGARRRQVTGKGGKTRAVPVEAALDEGLDAYLDSRRARFHRHDLKHPHRLVRRRPRPALLRRPGQVPDRTVLRPRRHRGPGAGRGAGARARHTFATSALEAVDTTRRYLDATAGGLRHVVRGHPGQIALRAHLKRTTTQSPPQAPGRPTS